MLTKTEVVKKDLVQLFAEATKNGNIDLIESLLAANGKFEIQNLRSAPIATNNKEFIRWYKERLENASIKEITYDHCLYCSMGKRLVIFNKGLFPYKVESIGNRTKSGLMIDTENDKIIEIKFCHTFAQTHNDFMSKEAIQTLIKSLAPNVPFDQAYEHVTGHKLTPLWLIK